MLQRTISRLRRFDIMSTYNMKSGGKIFNGSADRNKGPILDVLKQVHKGQENGAKHVLEISSGSGQHVVHFAEQFTQWKWQPSDCAGKYIDSIMAYLDEKKLPNIKEPIVVDVTTDSSSWGDGTLVNSIDLMININMIHITPIECTHGLFGAAGNLLRSGGRLMTYGPYAEDGILVPESNVNFDAWLKSENPAWGVRDVAMLKALAKEHGIILESMFDMPANNKCLCFVKS